MPCALFCAVLIAGCGGDEKKTDTGPSGTPDTAAKTVAQAYLDAYAAKDAKAICTLLTPKVQTQLADNKGTCVKTVRFSIKTTGFPKLEVADARAEGDMASATVQGSERQVRLQRVGSTWKVSDGGS